MRISLKNVPTRIGSLRDYQRYFGLGPHPVVKAVNLDAGNNFVSAEIDVSKYHYMYDAIRAFYTNGGGDCYITSIGKGFPMPTTDDFKAGLDEVAKVDEPTILLFPDAVQTASTGLYDVQKYALAQCELLKDRVTICDLASADPKGDTFRTNIGLNGLKYGMAYTPWVKVAGPKNVTYADLTGSIFMVNGSSKTLKDLTTDTEIKKIIDDYEAVLSPGSPPSSPPSPALTPAEYELKLQSAFGLYKSILAGINNVAIDLPPSGSVAGVYAYVDRTRGVWKAPANVSLNGVQGPAFIFSESELSSLNIDVNAGKSINAIRLFKGKGTLIFGARTLAGNDNEWRYVPVRRFFNMAEESIKKASEQFVFEPNDANTWIKVKAMIENFLLLQWSQGALAGSKPAQAFYVKVGLGETMTALDILEGRMNVEIGMAVVRPAEFIILKFSHKMQES
jgi:phage tail sheath protein FI